MKLKSVKAFGIGIAVLFFILFTAGCATYYRKTQQFQDYVMQGQIEQASEWLDNNNRMQRGINRLLYLLNDGWVHWMLNDYSLSNQRLNEADYMIEDLQKNLALEGLALFTNPAVKPYRPEDFEMVFVNYYKALNYLNLGQYEDALVECRRMNIILYQLNDKYKERKNRYSDDAFAHVLIGLIYEAGNDPNNAFIAYRNALETYRKVYSENFGVSAPDQLKVDLLRTARQMGFYDELRQYEDEFGMRYKPVENPGGGDLVVIWHNGYGPVKAEWSINFSILRGEGGWVTFVNEEMGLSIPFYIGDFSKEEQTSFSDLSIVRIAFPKYVERKPVFTAAAVKANGESHTLELAEDVNAIAFKTLKDRMLRELSNSLLRFAVKRATEEAARRENKDVGAAISIINALTEKADTRNWQTLPYSISYTRISLPAGTHQLTLETNSNGNTQSHTFSVEIQPGQTSFYTYRSLETHAPSVNY
ncbi:MAG: COG3014 family protein [Bacteroidales bacterium]